MRIGFFVNSQDQKEYQDTLGRIHELAGPIPEHAQLNQNKLCACGRCGSAGALTEMYEPYNYRPSRYIIYAKNQHVYCQKCINIVKEEYLMPCALCGTHYPHTSSQNPYFCQFCYNNAMKKEVIAVQTQNKRAVKMGRIGDLTIYQWMRCLKHFNYSCAYCFAKHQVIEHYTSLDLGGHTTLKNCLPACQKCNIKKRGRLPETIPGFLNAHNNPNIQRWVGN